MGSLRNKNSVCMLKRKLFTRIARYQGTKLIFWARGYIVYPSTCCHFKLHTFFRLSYTEQFVSLLNCLEHFFIFPFIRMRQHPNFIFLYILWVGCVYEIGKADKICFLLVPKFGRIFIKLFFWTLENGYKTEHLQFSDFWLRHVKCNK